MNCKDEIHEECGVVGIYGVEHAARVAYMALQSLQHRGQQGCGIAAVGSDGSIRIHKEAGLVKDVFGEDELAGLEGWSCIGHVRYPTTKVGGRENLQPFGITGKIGRFALAHNGNIVNAEEVKLAMESRGHLFSSTSDSELFGHLIGVGPISQGWAANIGHAANQLDGAYATVVLTEDALYACRDKYGFRPLSLGRLENGYVVASETCALSLIGAEFIRDVEPGELLVINADGVHSHHFSTERKHRMCSMEYIYFARPDSVIEGCCVHTFRKRSGALLYEECPTKADLVTYVPESGMSAAIGYSEAGKIPLQMGLLKNMYVARTFIQPTQAMRNLGVRMKLSPMRSIVKDKSVVVVDDSIVRGTTSKQLVQMLRDAGAREVHMRIASPKYAWPCFYGIDTGTRDQLIAAQMSEQEICEFIGADSLYYLSEEALFKASERKELCTACFGGGYPTDLYGYSEEKE